ncbi:hypothetical protein GCK72_008622 [Caenorhabditis remanei]|uniref:F-box domain-containing protein n=1 Tax=Caenorhabditis remanei TaxID=31234 RepID=A0A6A5H162_CAERE|nr:hypothetical protein GCK72_008622 [Caenorhabditis remanei]KAF1760373.1 hypothetical protein GCK72_008622 [Caenorhabditis remanei]
MSTPFPLLNLPSTSLLNVIQFMEFSDFVILSFLSKRAKQSVELNSIKCDYICFNIKDSVIICMAIDKKRIKWVFEDRKRNKRSKKPVPLPDNVTLEIEKEGKWSKRWSMKKLSVRKWITHFKTLFQLTEFTICLCSNCHVFDMEDVRNTFPEVKTLHIWSDSVPDIDFLVRSFPTRNLDLEGCFEMLRHRRQVLIQNFDELVIFPGSIRPTPIDLDDLLLINGKRIIVHDTKLTEKDLNRFIKLWIKGSNPRMEELILRILLREEELDIENILKGISCHQMNVKKPITFKATSGRPVSFSGVIDYVVRFDGTKASIELSFDEDSNSDTLEMRVWHSHCFQSAQ